VCLSGGDQRRPTAPLGARPEEAAAAASFRRAAQGLGGARSLLRRRRLPPGGHGRRPSRLARAEGGQRQAGQGQGLG